MARAHRALTSFLLVGLLALSACGSSASAGGGGGGGGGGGSTAAPTTPPKLKPTALPKITMAFCQGILTLAEANQIMRPATPATTIRIDANASGGGSCNYEYAPYKAVVSVIFVTLAPPSASIADLAGQAASKTGGKLTMTPVSGLGDQAEYGVVNVPIQGQTYNVDAMDVIYGTLFFNCELAYLGTPQTAAEQGKLTQACQLVLSRL